MIFDNLFHNHKHTDDSFTLERAQDKKVQMNETDRFILRQDI